MNIKTNNNKQTKTNKYKTKNGFGSGLYIIISLISSMFHKHTTKIRTQQPQKLNLIL